jgi:AraC-like DNA-binding protein
MRPRDQVDAWREWFSPIFEIESRHDAEDSFEAENKVWDLGSLLVSRVSAPSVRVSRTKTNINKAPVDHWVLTYCRNGSTSIQTRSATLSAPPGVPFLWSLGQPSVSERTRVERIQVILPRDEFQNIASLLDAATGTVLNTPLGGLLADYMVALDRWLPEIGTDDVRRVAAGLHSMIVACVVPSSDRLVLADAEISRARKERVRRIIHQHLRSPQLSPEAICRMAGVSRSQLYRLFERSGGVVRYIQRLRLQAAHAILSDPTSTSLIHVIAEDLCFQDASSFTRAFRQEFDCAPSSVRAAAQEGVILTARVRTGDKKDNARFGDFLT